MTTEQGSFEREAIIYPVRAYKRIVSRIEKLVSSDGVDVLELVGQSGAHYRVEQTTTSKKRGDSWDSKTITIHTETEHWTLGKGTGTDHESLTDGLGYTRYEGQERVEMGVWNYDEYRRLSGINVNVFGKFDLLLRDLETPQASSAAEAISPTATEVITPVAIRPEFIDQYGHVNYKRFPDIFESGQDDLMEKCIEGGFDGVDSTYGVRNFVKRTDTTINGQLLAGDEVLQHTSIGRLGSTSITFNQRMEKDGQNVADQTMVVVIVDKDNKPLPIPEDLRGKLQPYLIETPKQ